MATYPGAIKSFAQQTDLVSTIDAADVNEAYDEIEAIQTELGADVAGSVADLVTRLTQSIADDGDVVFAAATRLAISSAAITVTQNWHTVDGEGDASDTLSTINGGAEGMILVIRPDDDAATITIDNAGNILTLGGRSIVLDDEEDLCVLIYDAGLTKWLALDSENALEVINTNNIRYWIGTVIEYVTDATVADGHAYIHIPADLNGYDLVEVHAEVITAGTTGVQTMQIANVTQAVDMLSTLLTIDTGETGSDTAAAPAVIYSDGKEAVATNDVLRIDIDVIHTTAAKGLIFTMGFKKP